MSDQLNANWPRMFRTSGTGFASCDGTIGPFAHLCDHGRFDFTLLFEQAFLTLLPSILFIFVASIRLSQLWRAKPVTVPSSVIYLKLGACIVLGILQISLLVKWVQIGDHAPAANLSIGAAAASFVATTALTLLTHQEQRRSIIPSTIITVYLLVSIFLDALRCRTLWLIGDATNAAPAYLAASIVARLVILYLENRSKRSILIDDWKSYGREATSGLLSRSVLFWANDFLLQGHKSSLVASNLYGLKQDLQSKSLLRRMSQHWSKYRNSGKNALFWNLLVSCRATILVAAVPRIGQAVCKVAEPFLVTSVISYVQQQGTPEAEPLDAGYALIAAVTLVCVLRRVTDNFYDQCKLCIQVAMRGSLVSTLLHHATLLEPDAKDGSAVLTLITADVNRIMTTADSIHELWIIPVEVVVAAWLLARQVGVGAIGPGIAFAISFVFGGYLGRFMGAAQKQWSESVQRRVGDTTMILGSMKETKMLGLSESWESTIRDLMENQIAKSRLYRGLFVLVNTAAYLPDRVAPALTFGIAMLMGKGNLDLATAFTSLAIMQLVLGPLARLTSSAPFIFTAVASAERIQEFIELSEQHQKSNSGAGKFSDAQESPNLPVVAGNPMLAARDAAINAKWSDEPTLKDMNFAIQSGSFTVIAGKVGSGKSILLRAMLGQLPCSQTLLRQPVGVAYCAQTTWLVNATARENIIGQSAWDEDWYSTVISACALDRDFQNLPGGDSTPVGSKGQTLSGGQKQRISLARAVYSRRQLVIIDDVLSGLDWETQRHVWKHVFSEQGLLRRNDITLVLATHALHLVKAPDSVILIGDLAPGRVVQGTLDELQATTNIQQLISTSQEEHDGNHVEDNSATGDSTKKATSAKKGEEKKDPLGKTGDLPLYKFFLDAVGWVHITHFLVAFVVFAVFLVVPDIWLKTWSEANSSPGAVNTAFYFGIFTLLGIGSLIATSYVVGVVLLDVSPSGTRNIHKRLLATIMRAPLSFFVDTDTGDLINRFTRDLMQVDLTLPLNIFFLARGVGICLTSTALVIAGSYYMGIVIVPMFVFVYYLQDFYMQTSRQLRFLDLEATAPLYNHFIETVDGAATIQAFGWESAFSSKGLTLLDDAQKPFYILRIIQIWLEVVVGLFMAVMTTMLITLCVSVPSSTSAGAIALAFTHVLSLGGMLAELVQSWTHMETPLGSVERIKSFESNTPSEKEAKDPQIVAASWPSEGRLELKSITASYKSPDGTSLKALDGVTVSIQPGQKVGICGRTGSGKSSLLSTLFRLLDLDSGSIVLDGVDIAKIPRNLLRSRLIAVPQEPKIFSGTLRANLRHVDDGPIEDDVSRELEDNRLIEALKRVELWEYISAKGGLDSTVEDLGLSQGQKQLAYLARALAHKDTSKVLILDEAMSAVDKVTEDLMVKVLKEDFVGHTVISVVHRLNTILEFDTVILLDRGTVAETGSPDELLKQEGGRFRSLWKGTCSP